MTISINLRQINAKDQLELKKVYFKSIMSIENTIYSEEQKIAWSSQAWESPIIGKYLKEGKGWLIENEKEVVSFAVRYPDNRLALLYCKKEFSRQGFGNKLINRIEIDAINERINKIETEASLLSYKLLMKRNWVIACKENIIINNTFFERYKMIKYFNNL